MIRPDRRPQIWMSWLLALLWLASLLRIFIADARLAAASGMVLTVYVVFALPMVRRQIQLLCAALALGIAGLAVSFDAWSAVWQGIERAVVFAAFFGTLTLLRATADRRPETEQARRRVATLDARERDSGLLVGANVLGAVLVVGVMAIFAPIVGHDAPFAARKSAAEASQRGMCLACLWSPFWVAMSICTLHLPDVPLWHIMVLGLGMNAVGLVVAQLLYTPDVGLGGLGRALAALAPALPPVAAAALAVVGVKAVTPYSTLQCLILAVPVLCIAVLAMGGLRRLLSAAADAGRGIGAMRGEVVLLTFSFAFGMAMQQALEAGGAGARIAALAPPPWAVIAFVVAVMSGLAFAGIHQVVTVTLVLVLFGTLPFGVSHLVLAQAALVGWGFASMTGLSAVSVAAAAGMFGVPLERIAYGPNIRFILAFGAVAVTALAALNAVIV